MNGFFSVDNVLFTVLGYPMSRVEFFGTLLYLWSVWLISERRMLTWPVGMVSVLLYMMVFYQIRLYSDAFEQVYYLGASAYGWRHWSRSRQHDATRVRVGFSPGGEICVWAGITLALSAALGLAMGEAHLWFPRLFPEPASYPHLDALTTVMSFSAMWLMARRRTESWIYWVIVDIIGIWLYFVKDVKFISILYVILLFLAARGLMAWLKLSRSLLRGAEARLGVREGMRNRERRDPAVSRPTTFSGA